MRMIKSLRRAYNPSTRRFLRQAEIDKLLGAVADRRTALGARDFAILKLLLWCGLRVSEVCELKIGDHAVEGGKHWLNVKGKGGFIRRVEVASDVWRAVEHYHGKIGASFAQPGDHVFQRTEGRGPRAKNAADKRLTRALVHQRVRRLAQSVGLQRVSPHALRHTFCVMARLAGSDLYQIQRAAGHSSIVTTSSYCHLTEDEHGNAFQAVDRLLTGKAKPTRKAAKGQRQAVQS
jgi:integrase/recombinase XerD